MLGAKKKLNAPIKINPYTHINVTIPPAVAILGNLSLQ